MNMIDVQGMWKSFRGPRKGATVEAICGISLEVAEGEIFGFLGPNGAGKTTTLRILATLLPPDKGRALVAGYDLLREPQQVRAAIGYLGQAGGTDSTASGRENLMLQGRLYGMTMRAAKERTVGLIEQFEMETFADRLVRSYSGGQRRRLDLALAIVHRPRLLFLDEPSIGLDPQSRANLWDEVRNLRATGATVFLTTHYLEEADSLCDRLSIIDGGRIVAEGTPSQLKQQIAGDVITLTLDEPEANGQRARELLQGQTYVRELQNTGQGLQVYANHGEEALVILLRLLENAGIAVRSVSLARPSLDDVFLRQTGRSLRDERAEQGGPMDWMKMKMQASKER